MALLATEMNDTGVLGIFNVVVLVVIISIMTLTGHLPTNDFD